MKLFIVFNYWNVPSQNFENYHKPPFRLTQLIYYFQQKKEFEKKTLGLNYLSNQEFLSVYKVTGIDVDGRIAHMTKAVSHIERSIVKYIMFAKNIPGFCELRSKDKLALITGLY